MSDPPLTPEVEEAKPMYIRRLPEEVKHRLRVYAVTHKLRLFEAIERAITMGLDTLEAREASEEETTG